MIEMAKCNMQWLQLLDATIRNTSASLKECLNGDFLTFLVLPSGITFELKLERTSFPHHLHSMHLKNDYKPRLPCKNTQFSSKIVLEKDVKRKYADFILIFGCAYFVITFSQGFFLQTRYFENRVIFRVLISPKHTHLSSTAPIEHRAYRK